MPGQGRPTIFAPPLSSCLVASTVLSIARTPGKSVPTELNWRTQRSNSASTQSDEERGASGPRCEDGKNTIRKMEGVKGSPGRFRGFLN
jgi:hypothetical protein